MVEFSLWRVRIDSEPGELFRSFNLFARVQWEAHRTVKFDANGQAEESAVKFDANGQAEESVSSGVIL